MSTQWQEPTLVWHVNADFSSVDEDGLLFCRPGLALKPGDHVRVKDGDGHECEGVVESAPHYAYVRLDTSTWVGDPNASPKQQ